MGERYLGIFLHDVSDIFQISRSHGRGDVDLYCAVLDQASVVPCGKARCTVDDQDNLEIFYEL